jgi:hypothetical protein
MTLAEFEAHYARRHLPDSLAACLSILPGVPDEFEWLWRAARLEQFAAMQCVDEEKREVAREHFGRGREFAARASRIDGARVEGVFWESVCALEAAQSQGSLAALATLRRAQKAWNVRWRATKPFISPDHCAFWGA